MNVQPSNKILVLNRNLTLTKILVVDDEPLITESLAYSLGLEGFEVETMTDGSKVLEICETFQPDLIVLDIMLPGMSGLEVCRRLRSTSTIPVIMLTARGDEIDRVMGLEVGADDYLAKPFSFRELHARIRALLRRVAFDQGSQAGQPITVGKLSLDPSARRVFKDDQELELSAREYDLLVVLMEHTGQALSRAVLHDRVWGEGWIGDPRTLSVHIRWLRLKIEDDPAEPRYIHTVRGFGYRLTSPEETADETQE
jgi:two-component system response regulator RegX3